LNLTLSFHNLKDFPSSAFNWVAGVTTPQSRLCHEAVIAAHGMTEYHTATHLQEYFKVYVTRAGNTRMQFVVILGVVDIKGNCRSGGGLYWRYL